MKSSVLKRAFAKGLPVMLEALNPRKIIVYGTMPDEIFNWFVRDSLAYGETFPCYLGLVIGKRQYRIECLEEAQDDFFGTKEEITRLGVRDFADQKFVSAQENAEQLLFSVESKITGITIINDSVRSKNGEEYSYSYGIIIETERKRWAITKSLYFSSELSIK